MSLQASTTTASANAAAVKAITNTSPDTSTRSGKIARLPAQVQEDLNQRLANHEPGRVILPWLNALPEVKTLLKAAFNNKAINEQNLSNWRRGGFHEWQHRQKYFACFRNVAQDAADIESTVGNLTEHAARLLALQFSMIICPPVILRGHPKVPDVPPTIINNFCKIARAIASLRQGDHAAARLKLQEQKSTLPQPPLKVNQANSSLPPTPTPSPPQAIPPILHPSSSIGHRLASIPTSPPPTEHRPSCPAPPSVPSVPFTLPASPPIKPIQAKSSPSTPAPAAPSTHSPFFILHSSFPPALHLRIPTLLDTILLPGANCLSPNNPAPPAPEPQTPPDAQPEPANSAAA